MSENIFHSVTLNQDKCRGCTNCLKHCPTEAIRVRKGKAKIIKDRCIDCGMCIRVCPYRAKTAVTDSLDRLTDYKYTVALPAPTLYAQFKNNPSVDLILTGLLRLGFDEVFEVARAAELVTIAAKELLEKTDLPKPIISSACPAVVRLIQMRFPNLRDNVLPLLSPMEAAAKVALNRVLERTEYKKSDIGIFFLTPCAAKVTCARAPIGQTESHISGCIPINHVYRRLATIMKTVEPLPISTSSFAGITWARNGGESYALNEKNRIAVDGINNVIKILEEVEDDQLNDVQFIEASACTGGCVGGPLTVENSFVAKTRIQFTDIADHGDDGIVLPLDDVRMEFELKQQIPARLDPDINIALRKMEELNTIDESLPGLDCGSCGAPTCRALAEDVVRGYATQLSCIFKLREKIDDLALEMVDLNRLDNWRKYDS